MFRPYAAIRHFPFKHGISAHIHGSVAAVRMLYAVCTVIQTHTVRVYHIALCEVTERGEHVNFHFTGLVNINQGAVPRKNTHETGIQRLDAPILAFGAIEREAGENSPGSALNRSGAVFPNRVSTKQITWVKPTIFACQYRQIRRCIKEIAVENPIQIFRHSYFFHDAIAKLNRAECFAGTKGPRMQTCFCAVQDEPTATIAGGIGKNGEPGTKNCLRIGN